MSSRDGQANQVEEAHRAIMRMHVAVSDPSAAMVFGKGPHETEGSGIQRNEGGWGGLGLILTEPSTVHCVRENEQAGNVEEGLVLKQGYASVLDIFRGSAASRCRPTVGVGDSILRVDATDVQGLSSRQVRQLLDGKIGTAVTLTNWSQQRSERYSVTMTRSHIPCIPSSGNLPKLYVMDLCTRVRDVFDDVEELSEALADEKENLNEFKLKFHEMQDEMRMKLMLTAEEADELRVGHDSLTNQLQVQVEELTSYKRELYDAKDQCTLLQGQLHDALEDTQEYERQITTLRTHIQVVEDRMQEMLSVSQCEKTLEIACQVQQRQWMLARFLTAWRLVASLERYATLEHVHQIALQRLIDMNRDKDQLELDSKVSSKSPEAPHVKIHALTSLKTRDTLTLYNYAETLTENSLDLGDQHLTPCRGVGKEYCVPNALPAYRSPMRVPTTPILHSNLETVQLARIFQDIVQKRKRQKQQTRVPGDLSQETVLSSPSRHLTHPLKALNISCMPSPPKLL